MISTGKLEKIKSSTCIGRKSVSKPTTILLDFGHIRGRVLHHGSGKAAPDTEAMRKRADEVIEFDPNWGPKDTWKLMRKHDFDTIVSNYVLNVLPPSYRMSVIGQVKESLKPGGRAYFAVRNVTDKSLTGEPYLDGLVTSANTFQCGYTKSSIVAQLSTDFDAVEIIYYDPSTIIAVAYLF